MSDYTITVYDSEDIWLFRYKARFIPRQGDLILDVHENRYVEVVNACFNPDTPDYVDITAKENNA